MISPVFVLSLCLASIVGAPPVEIKPGTILSFADSDEAQRILCTRDDFISRLSPFDRAARMKTDKEVSEEEFLSFIGKNVCDWKEDEIQKIESVAASLNPKLARYNLKLPKKVMVVKTTGEEEGGSPYTRGHTIILPPKTLAHTPEELEHTLAHELLHVATRYDPKIRKPLYEVIGFSPCNEIEFPEELRSRKCTNPDAPRNDHYVTITIDEKPAHVMLILFSREEHYDPEKGGEFFFYIDLKLLQIEEKGGKWKPMYRDGKAVLIDFESAPEFFEKVGMNTQYILHPEEIVAENFDFLVTGKEGLPNPEILEKLEAALTP